MLRSLMGTLKISDVIKVLGGIIASIAFILSPLDDLLIYKLYGEEVEVKFPLSGLHDPDITFMPEVLITPKSSFGVSNGLLELSVNASGYSDVSVESTYRTSFDAFESPRVFRLELPIDTTKSKQDTVFNYELKLVTRFSNMLVASGEFTIARNTNRGVVGQNNFTGRWTVQYLNGEGYGAMQIAEGTNRIFSGTMTMPPGLSKESEIAISGGRDGQSVWFFDSGEELGLLISNSTYEFNKEEGHAEIKGKLILCDPCKAGSRNDLGSYDVWIHAPYIKGNTE